MALLLPAGCASHRDLLATRQANSVADLAAYRGAAPRVPAVLSLEIALQLARVHNLDARIAEQEAAFQHELATQARLGMLPTLMMNRESSRRNRFDAASSQSISTGQQSLEPSFSSEKEVDTLEFNATWNLLDFGISFFHARQQATRTEIARQRARRVQQNLALEVTSAYWRAVSAREAADAAEALTGNVEQRLALVRKEMDEQTRPQIEALKLETRLLELLDELQQYSRDARVAKLELAKLIGIMPGDDFSLALPDFSPPERLAFDLELLDGAALQNRPELFEKDLEQALTQDEVYIAIAQMLPGISFFWRYEFDENRFLVFDEWNTAGIRATWDLLRIPQELQRTRVLKRQDELIAARRRALAIGILTQLRLAVIDYEEAFGQLALRQRLANQHARLLTALANSAEAGESTGIDVLEQRLRRVRMEARALRGRAMLEIALARVWNTVGHTPTGHIRDVDEATVDASTVASSSEGSAPTGPTE